MSEERNTVRIDEFRGLAESIDRKDLAPGAMAELVNMACVRNGELASRPGYRDLIFD